MLHLKALEAAMAHILSHYGGWGLFAISFLDSSFLAFPFINDLLLIKLASVHPYNAVWYSLQCTMGSVLGAYAIYFLTLHGTKLIWRRPVQEESRIRTWIKRNDFLSILVASLLPPPTPFKVFAVVAGGMRTSQRRFMAALVIGRGLRFSFEAWLGAYYGAIAQAYLRRNVVWLSVITAAAVVIVVVALRILRRKPHPS